MSGAPQSFLIETRLIPLTISAGMSPERPPKVFISYSQDSPDHMARVLKLADQLRTDGVDADIDQYESAPPQGWPTWMERQISDSDFILIVCTEVYKRRADGKEEYGKGRGVIWESILTTQYLYNAATNNTRFIPVLLEKSHVEFIPLHLQPASYYCIAAEEGYVDLYRRLTNQPKIVKPPLGKLKLFEPGHIALSKQPSLERREAQKSIVNFWNVPANRNPRFTGREDILAALQFDLQMHGRQAICGSGEMGKTEIAVEYAYRHRDEYTAVLWTVAESLESIKSGFSKIARLLDLPEKDDTSQDVIVAAVKGWLERNQGWLFIFDNADTPDLLAAFLPEKNSGHVLVTSRGKDLRRIQIAKPFELQVFRPQEAREFLLKRAARSAKQPPQDQGADPEEAGTLAAELGNMPLALEQAGAYISETQTSWKEYINKFRSLRPQL
jgi:hypothetical protein